jgi:hypothetical protein
MRFCRLPLRVTHGSHSSVYCRRSNDWKRLQIMVVSFHAISPSHFHFGLKVTPVYAMKGMGEWWYSPANSQPLLSIKASDQCHAPVALPPVSTESEVGWTQPIRTLSSREKSVAPARNSAAILRPVCSRNPKLPFFLERRTRFTPMRSNGYKYNIYSVHPIVIIYMLYWNKPSVTAKIFIAICN